MAALYVFIFITCFVQITFFLFIYTKYLRLETGLLHEELEAGEVDIETFQPVSVVICAKNEAENIKNYLPVVMDQAYPEYEVIVIDDGSTDGTQEILIEYENRYENLLTFRIEKQDQTHGGKKQALSHGVSLAKNEWIVVTDADCCPASNRWLTNMTEPLSRNVDIVLGISPYFSSGKLVKRFFRAETLFVALQYINFALSGLPYMGVGRNMAYQKKVFESHDIEAHWDLVSGDDDLFVNEMADSSNIEIAANMDGYTYSEGPDNVGQWFRQKMRHYTAGYRYNLLQKIWLGYYWISSLLLFLLIPIVIITFRQDVSYGAFFVVLLSITALIRWVVLLRSLQKLGEHNISFSVPIFDLAYILSVWIISPLSGFGWKRWK